MSPSIHENVFCRIHMSVNSYIIAIFTLLKEISIIRANDDKSLLLKLFKLIKSLKKELGMFIAEQILSGVNGFSYSVPK